MVAEAEPPAIPPVRPLWRRRWVAVLAAVAVFASLLWAVSWEFRASPLQARYFSRIAAGLTFTVEPGESPDPVRFPGSGPYDARYGYHLLPAVIERMKGRGFVIESQARQSPGLVAWMDEGYFPIYDEKSRAGLTVLDAVGDDLFASTYPTRSYEDFEAIPELVWQTLLMVENRTLLDPRYPMRNPALEWRRLGRAFVDLGLRTLGSDRNVPGASTLATQIEKFRHSPEGRTEGTRDKFAQMYTASVRAYSDGPVTLGARRRILRDYLNSIPFAGIAGYGEVEGLGDALWAWFGADFDEVNELLTDLDWDELDQDARQRAALAYRQVVMLVLAVPRPSYLLANPEGREALDERTRLFLDLFAREGLISPAFRDAVLAVEVPLRTLAPPSTRFSFVSRKAPDAVRTQLLPLTGIPSLYALDKTDLTVQSTYLGALQDSITALLQNLRDPAFVDAQGLRAFRLLERGDPAGVHYAFVLNEVTPDGNVVRVRADTYDAPFRLTDGTKLELGSTAKLRALLSYLEAIDHLHREHATRTVEELRAIQTSPDDRLTRWALDWLVAHPGGEVGAMLDAALDRTYSASPAERFFTGGGVHTFVNFDPTHDGRVMSVREAFRNSVNLPFIRIMRDVVNYHVQRLPGHPARALTERDETLRREYLTRFADREGQLFLGQYYRRHAGLGIESSILRLGEGRVLTPTRLAWAYRSVLPDADVEAFRAFVTERAEGVEVSEARVQELYRRADPSGVPLVDQGYLAGIHPLEIWLVRYLADEPEATLRDVIAASRDVRQEVYGWLFSTRRTAAQDQRIRSILEAEAFQSIHRSWQRLGYPFESLVPSYATAIGSSADRPDALAELVGILVRDGMKYPTRTVTEARFAAGTPFETELRRSPAVGERVLAPEVAVAARSVMIDVVENGTAVRARNAVRLPDGTSLTIGAKTGTGNNRHRVYGTGGRLLEDRALNRTSTLVFFIGDRFFGSITAFTTGPSSDTYGFTSSLTSQVLRMAGPLLVSVVSDATQQ